MRVLVRSLLVLATLGAGAPALAGPEEPVRLPLRAEDLPEAGTEWYGVYAKEDKIGWARMRSGPDAEGRWSVEWEADLKVVAAGERMRMRFEGRDLFEGSPPYGYLGGTYVEDHDGAVKRVEVSRRGTGFSAVVREGDEERRLEGPVDYTLADALAESLWAQGERRVGDRLVVRSFDGSDFEASTRTYEVVALREATVSGVRVPYLEVRSRSSKRGEPSLERVDRTGRLLSARLGPLFEVRLETEATARRTEWSADLFVLGMARADRPIGEPTRVARLVLEAEGDGAAALPSCPRQVVYRDGATGRWRVLLGAAYGERSVATEAEVAEALAETVSYPVKHPRIAALAREAVGDARDAGERVERLVAFVSDYVRDDLGANSTSALEVVASRRGDCTEHALLFTTLARAAGVPAREVSGLMYMGDDAQAFGGHAWNEVALDGRWVPVDSTWGQVEIDATHVTLRRDGVASPDGTAFGDVAFRVLKVERRR